MFGKLIILMVSNSHQTSSSSKNSRTVSTIWSSGHDYDVIIGEQQEGQTFCITRNWYKHHARTAEVSLVNPVFQDSRFLFHRFCCSCPSPSTPPICAKPVKQASLLLQPQPSSQTRFAHVIFIYSGCKQFQPEESPLYFPVISFKYVNMDR